MTTRDRALRQQAISDLMAFEAVVAAGLPDCHGLHYLQMASEKLGKAIRAGGRQRGAGAHSHVAIVKAMRMLRNDPTAARVLWSGRFVTWRAQVDRLLPLAEAIERLAPAIACAGENAEYPRETRPGSGRWIAPAAHAFTIMTAGRESDIATLLSLLRRIDERFDELFR